MRGVSNLSPEAGQANKQQRAGNSEVFDQPATRRVDVVVRPADRHLLRVHPRDAGMYVKELKYAGERVLAEC